MSRPLPETLADGGDDDSDRARHADGDPGEQLQTYAALLDECYALLSRRAALETEPTVVDPTALNQHTEIEERLGTVQSEIDALADDFDQCDFRRAIRYLLQP